MNICETCNEDYIMKKMIYPYHKNCAKLLALADTRDEEYGRWGKMFSKVHVEVKDKTDVVKWIKV